MSTRSTVIAYHAVGECAPEDDPHSLFITLEAFERQMDFLAQHRRVVTLAEAVAGPRDGGAPAVAITFDDGYRSVLECAVPVLEDHNFPATIFVPTKWLGDHNRWDPPSRCPLSIMDVDELRTAAARGFSIETHGHEHRHLEGASEEIAAADIAASLAVLGKIQESAVRFLAYPFSHGSPDAQRAAQAAGLNAAFSIDRPGTGRFDFPRVQITPYDGTSMFRLKTSGRYLGLRFSPAGRLATVVTRPLRRGRRLAATA